MLGGVAVLTFALYTPVLVLFIFIIAATLAYCQSIQLRPTRSVAKITFILAAAIGALVVSNFGALAAHPAIDVAASNWKFTPDRIEAHVGEETTLKLTSSAGVHGIEFADLGIAKTLIVPGRTVTVKFTPKAAGTYDLHCSIVCGTGHEAMVLTVKVLP